MSTEGNTLSLSAATHVGEGRVMYSTVCRGHFVVGERCDCYNCSIKLSNAGTLESDLLSSHSKNSDAQSKPSTVLPREIWR